MVDLNVKDMTCGHCVSAVTRAVKALDPQADVHVDLGSKRVRVQGLSSTDDLIRALNAAGYSALPAGDTAPVVATRKSCCGCG